MEEVEEEEEGSRNLLERLSLVEPELIDRSRGKSCRRRGGGAGRAGGGAGGGARRVGPNEEGDAWRDRGGAGGGARRTGGN